MGPHSFPLSLRISENFSPTEITFLQEQADAWESSIDRELDFFDYDFPAVENLETPHAQAYEEHPTLGPHLGIYRSTQWPDDFGPGNPGHYPIHRRDRPRPMGLLSTHHPWRYYL